MKTRLAVLFILFLSGSTSRSQGPCDEKLLSRESQETGFSDRIGDLANFWINSVQNTNLTLPLRLDFKEIFLGKVRELSHLFSLPEKEISDQIRLVVTNLSLGSSHDKVEQAKEINSLENELAVLPKRYEIESEILAEHLHSAMLSPSERFILTTTGCRILPVRLWAIGVNEKTTHIPVADMISAAIFSPNDDVLVASCDLTVTLWNRDGGQLPVRTFANDDNVSSLFFSPDGRHFLARGRNLVLWDITREKRPLKTFGQREALSFAFSPDNKWLVVLSGFKARLWNIQRGWFFFSTSYGTYDQIPFCAFSPNSQLILTATGPQTLALWDINHSRKPLRTFNLSSAISLNPVFSPDGRFFLVGAEDGAVTLWETENNAAPFESFEGHGKEITAAAFSPDGSLVLTGSEDKTARLWGLNYGGHPLMTLEHTHYVFSVAFSRDAQRLFTASREQAILWQVMKPEVKP